MVYRKHSGNSAANKPMGTVAESRSEEEFAIKIQIRDNKYFFFMPLCFDIDQFLDLSSEGSLSYCFSENILPSAV